MIVIGIIGARASGKDTAARYIAEKYHGRHHAHSEILDDILGLLALDATRANTDKLAAFRDRFGENWLVKALNKKIKSENAPVEVITGIRFKNEFDNIRSYPDNKIIYLETDPLVRFERMKARGQRSDEAALTFERFIEMEASRTQKEIPVLGAEADFKIHHDGTSEELYPKLDAVLQGIIH